MQKLYDIPADFELDKRRWGQVRAVICLTALSAAGTRAEGVQFLATCAAYGPRTSRKLHLSLCCFVQLSGLSFHKRLIAAYEQGTLEPCRKTLTAAAGGGGASSLKNPPARGTGSTFHTPTRTLLASSHDGSAATDTGSAPARAAVIGSRVAVDVTPALSIAPVDGGDRESVVRMSVDDETADERLVICAECGADGHWRWECPKRL